MNSTIALNDASQVIDLFQRAAEANFRLPHRKGSTIELPAKGQLLATGDLHDNRMNLEKILKLAKLDASPDHHLFLHEVLHSGRLINGMDMSYRTLALVAEMLVQRPEQVHVLMGNHELSQIHGHGITKEGVNVVAAFTEGVEFVFGDDADEVMTAVGLFIRSLPLAIRCENGILCAHSLPSPMRMKHFDPTVLDRVPTEEDLSSPTGSAYLLVWGRNMTEEEAVELGQQWGVKTFVLGHQKAEMGYETYGESVVVLASDHEHGVALPIDLTRPWTRDELLDQIVPLAAVG